MGTKHKHAEVIKAWADGAEIEHRFSRDELWKPCKNNCPGWLEETQYRVKPKEPIKVDRNISITSDNIGLVYKPFTKDNVRFSFDPDTLKLIKVELIND